MGGWVIYLVLWSAPSVIRRLSKGGLITTRGRGPRCVPWRRYESKRGGRGDRWTPILEGTELRDLSVPTR